MNYQFLIIAVALPVFFFVSIRKPAWAFGLIFAVAPFPNDTGVGVVVNVSLGELLTIILFFQMLLTGRKFKVPPILLPVGLYAGICVLSVLVSGKGSSVAAVLQMCIYLVVAVLVGASCLRKPGDVRAALHGLILSGTVLSSFAIATGSNYFLGLHKNAVGGALACSFLAAFVLWEAERRRKARLLYLAVTAINLCGLLMIASRGAWLGTLAALVLILVVQRRVAFAVRLGLLSMILIPIFWTLLPEDRQEFATGLSVKDGSVASRLNFMELAKERFLENPILGSGVGFRKEQDSTNLVMSTLAETGIVGLLALSGVIYASFRALLQSIRRCRSTVVLPLVTVCLALFTSRLVHGLVDHYWSRGVLLLAWLGLGMAWRIGVIAAQNRKGRIRSEVMPDAGVVIPSVN